MNVLRALPNIKAAVQVLWSLPGRTLLLAAPVAVGTGLALATLAIDYGLNERAQAAARSFGQDVVSVRSGTRIISGQSGTVGTLTEEDVAALRSQLRDVKAVEGTRIEDNVPMTNGGKSGVYRVFAVRPLWADVRQFGAAQGEFLHDSDIASSARVAVIGQTVARELFGDRDPVGAELMVNQVPFRIKGVLVAKGASPAEGDRDARIVIPISTFYNRLYRRLHLDQVVVQAETASPELLDRLQTDIQRILRQRHGIAPGEPDDFTIRPPDLIAEQARGISRAVLFLLLGLAVLCAVVAATVIGVVFTQAVRSRRAEIGIRRAIGATPSDILWQVWAEGSTVSFIGGVAGFLLGWKAAQWLAEARNLAFGFNALVVSIPAILALLSSFAGWIPAWRAARLDPADALRRME
jgi:putative ABC transport system permease protein